MAEVIETDEKKHIVTLFPELYQCPRINMRRVFPTMQKRVYLINRAFATDQRIASIVLFGSAASMRCHQRSDIDLLVRLYDNAVSVENKNEISERIQALCDWQADILWYDRISQTDRVYEEVLKGVQIV